MAHSSRRGLYRFVTDDGTDVTDGGDPQIVGDFSSTAKKFWIEPQPGEVFAIRRLLIHAEGPSTPMAANQYCSIPALTNGMRYYVAHMEDGVEVVDYYLDGGLPILVNSHYGRVCKDSDPDDYGSGPNFVVVRWTLQKGGEDVFLDGYASERLVVLGQDNLLDPHFPYRLLSRSGYVD